MKSSHLLILGFLSHLTLQAQMDTLYVNNTHTMALVFPNPIARAITGHPNYQFGYDAKKPNRLGLLQGNPGSNSNLLVLTEDGLAYFFALAYRKELLESNRFIKVVESIGNVGAKKAVFKTTQQPDSLQYQKTSNYFLERNRTVLRTKRKHGIILELRDVAYYGKETYIVMEIRNRSAIDFEVDFIQVFKIHGDPRKKSSYQKLVMKPIYGHEMPLLVKAGHKQHFVYVVSKFTLGDQEKLLVELREKRGSREILLQWH